MAAVLLLVALLAASDGLEDAPCSRGRLEWLPTLNPMGPPLAVAWMPHVVCEDGEGDG